MDDENSISRLDEIGRKALEGLEKINEASDLERWKVENLGRSAPVMEIFSHLTGLDSTMRPLVGQAANRLKQQLEKAYGEREQVIKTAQLKNSLETETLDISLPGRQPGVGRLHPVTQTLRQITDVFSGMGFQVYRSREVETDEFSFGLLNIPPYHPARDMWDTFHTTTPGVVLRPHTSPGQIHVMRQFCPEPIRAILPGMCYRYEQMDARHESQLMQVELLVVGRDISLGNLKGTLQEFARGMFGAEVRTRFRPSYFPFTEPSGDMEIECFICSGKGCRVCSQTGWLEILGCGMVHPTVLQNGGYDPEVFSGFAAGMGVERVAMLRHHVEEIRYFYGNDVRFLEQF
jgi:phenylalanyl-tRNA synthetase alpha chain